MIKTINRVCHTRKLKEKGCFNRSKFYFHSVFNPNTKAVALFNGTIHFVAINFGGVSVPLSDIKVALQHTTLSSPILAKYCSQYGPNTINVDQNIISFDAPSNAFSDSQLQSWIDTIARQNNIPHNDALIILSPQGANNADAPISQGVLGYHGMANLAYSFINVLGTGLTLNDKADLYAEALTHEIGEMAVDPAADLSNPEDSDPCSGNCNVNYRNYFDSSGNWLGINAINYAFFTAGIATPAEVNKCPASVSACIYNPNAQPVPPIPNGGNLLKWLIAILGIVGALIVTFLLHVFG